jgi:hypothetical protein
VCRPAPVIRDAGNGERELVMMRWGMLPPPRTGGTCSVTTYNWQKTEVMKTWLTTSSDLDELLSGIHEWIREYVRLGRKYAFPRVKGKPGSIFDHDD